ncbi:MAG: outer membrane lipoprotein chaperone LolA [Pseudomonadota bacterium]
MMQKFQSNCLLWLFCLVLPLSALANNAAEDLQQNLSQIKSLSANFEEKVYDQQGTVLQTQTGRLAITRPNRFRWQVNKPTAQLIITNGDKLWVYDPGLQQVTISKLSHKIDQTPILLLSSNQIDFSKTFTVAKQRDGSYLLKPKQTGQSFESVRLWFRDNKITRLSLYSNVGQHSDIYFHHVRLNQKLNDDLFQFQAPKGVDVVDQYNVKQ